MAKQASGSGRADRARGERHAAHLMFLLSAFCGFAVFTGGGHAPPALRTVQSRARAVQDSLAIVAVAQGIIAADNAKDLSRVLSYYADSAVLLPPNEGPVVGRAAIRPRYERLFGEFDPAIVGAIDELVVGPEWAYVRGRNRRVLRRKAGGPDRVLNDIYIMLLRREGVGQWRISRLMWHAGA
ncbi:MAG TPA: nuclear transport factor 2 family protein [Gemmatimonadaceae bacterium]|nr:nuclear transport factor 2 family protein [Gemmatimonadaceae bacterium]